METYILEDEFASRAYLDQVWAEAMEIYRSRRWKLTFSPEMVRHRLELFFQSPDVCRVRQAEGMGTRAFGNRDEKTPDGFQPVSEQMELPF